MRKNFIMLGMILLVGIIILSIAIKLKPSYSMFSPSSQSYIDNMIVNKMKDDHIPGMSILIVKIIRRFLIKAMVFQILKRNPKSHQIRVLKLLQIPKHLLAMPLCNLLSHIKSISMIKSVIMFQVSI